MKKKKMRSPLQKRVPKELIGEWRKYLVIFLLLAITIGFVSGMYVANNSMLTAIDESVTKYKQEYGHFELNQEADAELLAKLESGEQADIWAVATEEARKEADAKIDAEARKQAEEQAEKLLEEGVRSAIETEVKTAIEAQVKSAIEAQVQQMIPAGTPEYEAALKQAMDQSYDAALQQAMSQSYDAAVKQAMNEAYDEALKKAKEESYEEVLQKILDSEEFQTAISDIRKEAYEEIDKKVNEEKEKQEAKKSEEQRKAEENFFAVPVKLYKNYYKDVEEDWDRDGKKNGKVRLYRNTDEINHSCYLEGEEPKNDSEIAIDRMHADCNGVKVGDTIRVQGRDMKVTGLIAMVNYSTLYEKNTDSMFDAISFDVAVVTPEAFDLFDVSIHYNYAWMYDTDALGEKAIDPQASEERQKEQQKTLSDNYMLAVMTQSVAADNELKDFVPRYGNMAMKFAKEDLSGDEVMVGILLYIFIVMIAFIFGVTITSTINKEASAIGTLRASGYTKGELVRHYMTVPVFVTLFSSIIGNVLGYTAFKFIVVGMYYNSYSLPTYVTIWNSEAFIRTTLIPVIIMILVTWLVIRRAMRFSPLRFLRHDLRSSKRKKAVKLPHFPFFHRFRLRVILQNIPNYLVLFFGLAFVMILLAFSFGLPSTLNSYTDNVVDEMFVKNQYILKTLEDEDGNELTTKTEGAEKFSITDLKTTDGPRVGEAITAYGVVVDSKYLAIPAGLAEDEVYISSAYRDKFKLQVGDSITLKKPFAEDKYTFKVAGVMDYTGGLIVIMPQDHFNSTFGYKAGSFSGYMSNEEITDIAKKDIAASITEDDILKISRQLNHSMGDYMAIFQVVCFILALILIYMLTKVIIERNENAISMVKILGYENKEIASLYLISTTWFVLISAIITAFAGVWALSAIWVAYMKKMDGWLPVHFGATDYLWIIGITFGAYLVVMLLDYFRIRRVPMDEALKNVE
ncbi:MAG: FtsX-like permease family protein [Eubacterium sp.]|nr:FtsX-like permease family protein [Eubacterium sp.]